MARGVRKNGGKSNKASVEAQSNAEEPKVAPAVIGSNVTDETIRQHALKAIAAHNEFMEAQDEAKKKQGVYRAVIKDAKKDGVNHAMLAKFVTMRRQEPADIDRDTRDLNRIARIMEFPIGSQLGLFDNGKSVATAVEDQKQAEAKQNDLEDARFAGQEAGKRGDPHSKCQYEEGTQEHEAWMDAWGKEQAAIALNMGRGGAEAGAAAH